MTRHTMASRWLTGLAYLLLVTSLAAGCDRNSAADTPADPEAPPEEAAPSVGAPEEAPGEGAVEPALADEAPEQAGAVAEGETDEPPAAPTPGEAAEAPVEPAELTDEAMAPFLAAIREVAAADAREREGEPAQIDFIRGTLGEDDALHVVALWFIEGPYRSNSWMQRLGLFRITDDVGGIETVRILDAGERASRDISRLMEIRDNQLIMTVQLWAEDDPACCPSPDPQIVSCNLLHETACAVQRP